MLFFDFFTVSGVFLIFRIYVEIDCRTKAVFLYIIGMSTKNFNSFFLYLVFSETSPQTDKRNFSYEDDKFVEKSWIWEPTYTLYAFVYGYTRAAKRLRGDTHELMCIASNRDAVPWSLVRGN